MHLIKVAFRKGEKQIETRVCMSWDGNAAQMECDGIEEGSWNTGGVGWNTDGDGSGSRIE